MAQELNDTALLTDADIVAYYRLEDAVDTKAFLNLTNIGTTPFNAAKYNNGGDLGASNTTKWLKGAASTYGIVGATPISIVGWFNLYTASGTQSLLAKREDTNVVSYIIEYDGTTLKFYRRKHGVANETATYTVTLSTSTWYHVALTYDGTNIRGYLDGSLVAGPTAASGDGSGTSENAFRIGTEDADAQPSSAKFDDVAIFKRALTAAEISTLGIPDAAGGGW